MNLLLHDHNRKVPRNWLKATFLNFFIATCIGALLRFAFVVEIPWIEYRFWLHGHSHIAILGWGYLILYALYLISFLPENHSQFRFFNRLFWITQCTVIGMAISFPIQGYGLFSIFFSTCHIICAYVFLFRFWKIIRASSKISWSVRFLKAAFIFFFISSLALWAMAPIMKMGLQQTSWYYQSIQFYLHFHFNGWFIFSVFAIFFKWIENQNISLSHQNAYRFFVLLIIATVLTFALAVTWSNPQKWLFWINSSGLTIQLLALIVFILLIRKQYKSILDKIINIQSQWLWKLAFTCFGLKIVFQTMIILPFVSTIAYTIRNFVIGFLHLILLGVLSMFCLGFLSAEQYIRWTKPALRGGLYLFLTAFLLTESLLFVQGLLLWTGLSFIPFYYEILAMISFLFPISVALLSSYYFSKISE